MLSGPGGAPVRILALLYGVLGGCLAILLPMTPLMFVSVALQGGPPGGAEEWPMVIVVGVLCFVLGAFGSVSVFTAWSLWRGLRRGLALGVGVLWLMAGMWPLGLLAMWALLREKGQEVEL